MNNHLPSPLAVENFVVWSTSARLSTNFQTAHSRVLKTIETIISQIPARRASALFRKTRGGKRNTVHYEMTMEGWGMVLRALDADNTATQRYTVRQTVGRLDPDVDLATVGRVLAERGYLRKARDGGYRVHPPVQGERPAFVEKRHPQFGFYMLYPTLEGLNLLDFLAGIGAFPNREQDATDVRITKRRAKQPALTHA